MLWRRREGVLLGEPTRRRPVLPGPAPPRRPAVGGCAPTCPWYVRVLDSTGGLITYIGGDQSAVWQRAVSSRLGLNRHRQVYSHLCLFPHRGI